MIAPRPHLANLYRDVEWGTNRTSYIRLDRNEKVSHLGDDLKESIFKSLHPDILNAYPDPSPLYERLSAQLGVTQRSLFVTSGSDTAIRRVFETFVRSGDLVLQPDPSYAMYRVYTEMYEAKPALVPYTDARTLPVDELLARLDDRPRLLLVANPDQPTGTFLDAETLQRLAAKAQQRDVVMLIDEAYHPFHPQSALTWRHRFENVLVSRTFSKVGGLAGLRIGYLVGDEKLIDWVQRTRGSHEVNSVAIAVACWLLDHPEVEEAHLQEVVLGLDVLRKAASRLGFELPDCHTNFQLMRFAEGTDLNAVVGALKSEGFLIKGPFSSPALKGCLRVSLAGPEVIEPFVVALEKVLVAEAK